MRQIFMTNRGILPYRNLVEQLILQAPDLRETRTKLVSMSERIQRRYRFKYNGDGSEEIDFFEIDYYSYNKLLNYFKQEGKGIFNDLYLKIQHHKCIYCEQIINKASSEFIFFNDIYNITFNFNYSEPKGLYDYFGLPTVNGYSQALCCKDCDRASKLLSLINHKNTKVLQPFLDEIPFYIDNRGRLIECQPPINDKRILRCWPVIQIFNLNRPKLLRQRMEIFQDVTNILKKEPRTWQDSDIARIFSIAGSFTLARHSAIKSFFGKKLSCLDEHGPFIIDDFIRAYEYLEEVENDPGLASECGEWRPDLILELSLPGIKIREKDVNVRTATIALNQYFRIWSQQIHSGLKDSPEIEDGASDEIVPARPPQFIRNFRIKNYRGLTTDTISLEAAYQSGFSIPDAAFLADNAAGKTRLLQALFWALAGKEDVTKILEHVPKIYHPIGMKIEIQFFDRESKEKLAVEFPKDFGLGKEYVRTLGGENYSERIPMLAFGSNRAPALSEKGDAQNGLDFFITSTLTIFLRDKHVPYPLQRRPFNRLMVDNEGVQNNIRERAISWLLNSLVPNHSPHDYGRVPKRSILFKFPTPNGDASDNAKLELSENTSNIAFDNWSEGFQTIFTLALAILVDCTQYVWANNDNVPNYISKEDLKSSMSGIVLIDEFDAHLHPRWRLRIMKQMKSLFPNVQFIFTTHDPVILRGMESSQVFCLPPPDEAGVVKPFTLNGATHLSGFETDDLLLSELFGLDVLRDESENAFYQRYLELLLKHSRSNVAEKTGEDINDPLTDQEKNELQFLRRRCGGGFAGLGHPRDQLLLPAIDMIYSEYLEKLKGLPEAKQDIEKESIKAVKQCLVNIWNL